MNSFDLNGAAIDMERAYLRGIRIGTTEGISEGLCIALADLERADLDEAAKRLEQLIAAREELREAIADA